MHLDHMANLPTTGYLELIIGPMYSGKTSRLVEIYNKCEFCNIPVAVINHDIDNRYDQTLLSTHDKIMIPCMKTTLLRTLLDNQGQQLLNADVILINEGQFFEDLYDFVCDMVQRGKKVYVCGLDGDFKRNSFGKILDLIPLCDSVCKLTSLCSMCKDGTKAIFTLRISHEKEQTVVGSENYKPVCRRCYEQCMFGK